MSYLDVQLGVFPEDLLDAAVVATLGWINPWALRAVVVKLLVTKIGGARDEVRMLLRRGGLGWWGGRSVEAWSVSMDVGGPARLHGCNAGLTRQTYARLDSVSRYSRCLDAERSRRGCCPRRPTCWRCWRRGVIVQCAQEQGKLGNASSLGGCSDRSDEDWKSVGGDYIIDPVLHSPTIDVCRRAACCRLGSGRLQSVLHVVWASTVE
jgi:hypothetical protein